MKIFNMMKRYAVLIATSGLMVSAMQAQTLADFGWSAELTVPANGGVVRTSVPTTILAGLRSANGDDLRVVNGSGALLPFALIAEQAGQTVAPAPSQSFKAYPLYESSSVSQETPALRIIDGGGQRVVELSGAPARALQKTLRGLLYDTRTVKTPVRSLEITGALPANTLINVTLMSSRDLKDWQPVVVQQPLFNFSEGGPGNKRLSFSAPLQLEDQYLRLTWDTTQQFPETAIQLEFAPSVAHRAPATQPLGAPTKQSNDFAEWLLPSRYQVQALRLQTTANNALMPVRILTRERDTEAWQMVASTVVYRLAANGGAERVNPSLPVTARLASQLRVEPAAGYSLATMPIQLALDYAPMQVVFVATGDAPFRLLAGAEKAQRMNLPLATVIPGYQAGMENSLPNVQVGQVLGAAETSQALKTAQSWFNQRTALWAVLIVAVLVLGAIALSLLRSAQSGAQNKR